MNATRPEARTEYSNTVGGPIPPGLARNAAVALAFFGAVGLIVAEFLELQHVLTIARHPVLVHSITTGSHDGFSLIPIALLAIVFVVVALRSPRPRAGWSAATVLGLAGVAVALLVDRRHLHAVGAVTHDGTIVAAQIRAGTGIYLETAAALALTVGAAAGLLLSAPRSQPRNRETTHRQQTQE